MPAPPIIPLEGPHGIHARARRAGKYAANVATVASANVAATMVSGSVASNWNRRPEIWLEASHRATAIDAGPTAMPIATRSQASRTTIHHHVTALGPERHPDAQLARPLHQRK